MDAQFAVNNKNIILGFAPIRCGGTSGKKDVQVWIVWFGKGIMILKNMNKNKNKRIPTKKFNFQKE
jgi:hypothetical protein